MDTSFFWAAVLSWQWLFSRARFILEVGTIIVLEQGSMLVIIWLCGLSKCEIWHM